MSRFLDPRIPDSSISRLCILDIYESRRATGMYEGLEDTPPLLASLPASSCLS